MVHGGTSLSDPFTLESLAQLTSGDPVFLARDEAFWARFAVLYDRDPSFVQLNYGYYHPSLRPVLEVEISALRESNRRGSHFKFHDSQPLLEAARSDVASLLGAPTEAVALTRSSSESINQVIQGLRLERGDEVVASDMDYVAVQQVLDQRTVEDGIVVRRVEIPRDAAADVTPLFAQALGPRTRLMVVTHLIHSTGRVLPAQQLAALGRRAGVAVFVDAAHSFGQVPVDFAELGCDYLCTSLHKWLGAPLGNGVLAVRKERIASLKPLYGDVAHDAADIRRFERLGNRSDAALAGLREAVRWHRALTGPVKAERLRYLHARWADALRNEPGLRLHSPGSDQPRGGIGMVTVEGWESQRVLQALWDDHRLFASVQPTPWGGGVRIVPGMPTSADEIDTLAEALKALKKTPSR
jgi:selenocysteine lyase/cysteine desulfurase